MVDTIVSVDFDFQVHVVMYGIRLRCSLAVGRIGPDATNGVPTGVFALGFYYG
jgi:hypothetical protein